MSLIHKISLEIGQERAKVLEEHINLHIQPRPRWLPYWIWAKIIRRLLVLEVFQREVKDEG